MKKILLIIVLIIAILAIFWFFLQPKEDSFDGIECQNNLVCLKDAAKKGEKARIFLEETATPYSQKELREFESQGITPPEKKGTVFSHTLKKCNSTTCIISVKVESFETGTPDFIVTVMQNFNEMECEIPIEDLGTIPEDISNCSGPFIEGLKILEEQYTAK